MRTLLAFLVCVALVAPTRDAGACDGKCAFLSQSDMARTAEAIFLGRPLARTLGSNGDTLRYDLEVLRAWKGVQAGDRVIVQSDTSDCGIGLDLGRPVLLYVTNGSTENGLRVFPLFYCGTHRIVTGSALAGEAKLLGDPSSEVAAGDASSCTCLPADGSDPKAALAASRSAIFGRIASVRTNTATSLTTYEIKSIRILKGRRWRAAARLMLATPSTGCGLTFARGDHVLLFLDREPQRYWPDVLKACASQCEPLPVLSGRAASAAAKALRGSASSR